MILLTIIQITDITILLLAALMVGYLFCRDKRMEKQIDLLEEHIEVLDAERELVHEEVVKLQKLLSTKHAEDKSES